jgi:hypothetical protein
MTPDESAGDALFRGPLPAGFSRQVLRVAAGLHLDLEARGVPGAIVVVEEGVIELECRSGTRRRFGRGSMIPIARLPLTHVRSVGPGPLVLLAVSRASRAGPMSFRATPDRTSTADYDFGG